MSLPDRQPRRFSLGQLRRTRRQLAGDIVVSSSRLDQAATAFETADKALDIVLNNPAAADHVWKMGSNFVRTVFQSPLSPASPHLQPAVRSVSGADQLKEQPEAEVAKKPLEEPGEKTVENPYAAVDALIDQAVGTASLITDTQLRCDTLVHIGKAQITGYRAEEVAATNMMLFQQSTKGHLVLREFAASAQLHRVAGNYELADKKITLAGKADAQWYLDTAVIKAQDRRNGQKLDPKPDLENARKDLPVSVDNAAYEDIGPLSRYATAHFKATGEYPAAQLAVAQDILDWMYKYNYGGFLGQVALQQTEALVKAYSAAGGFEEAMDVIDLMPSTADTVEIKLKALQQVASDALEKWDICANVAAEDAIKILEEMPAGEKKDELMATIGVDMYMVQSVASYKLGEPSQLFGLSEQKALDIIGGTLDPITRANAWRTVARRDWNKGDEIPAYFNFAFAE
jgi:hypothetical protein